MTWLRIDEVSDAVADEVEVEAPPADAPAE